MTLTVDCRHIDASGVGVYIRECLPVFLESAHRFVLLGDGEKLAYATAGKKNVRVVGCRVKPFSLRELFFFPRKILKIVNAGDVFYSPFFNVPGGIRVPVYTTIHDIVFPDMPELASKAGLRARMWFYRRAGKLSQTLFTVSEFSKVRLLHYLGGDKRIVVTGSAIQGCYTAMTHAAKNRSIIFIGNIKKHTGLAILLDAFEMARREGLDYDLIVVGSKENLRSRDTGLVSRIAGGGVHVRVTGCISNDVLRDLIVSAALLVQPSLYEGFCLPPLEAMMLGTQALVSDIPVLKEVYAGFPVVFFKAGCAEDLKEKLIGLLRDKPFIHVRLDEELRGRYTFQKTAAVILEELGRNRA
jgi:glycosyltransferase involved in cell wall biosynthesis